ncbi:oligoendopeptidase F [Ktedonosporobacter rubrisoli]|uniref:Oligopeptidase F n=1 Tax=Ktedonosporobacter rubrisoli TaxID=2509675 RepID=A0A4V0YZ04_KTERU|nr:oligoendopeptidase F [Ktedonosporobacter rubrisoli]QBD78031.1 oligoendopeptidase F [Ktedonosporobacter rubrisoli]
MQILYKKREEIPAEFTWNLESIFASNDEWEQAFKAIQNLLPQLERLKGTLAQSGKALLTVLQKRDEIFEPLERLYVYSSMRKDEDTTKGIYQGMADRAMQLLVQATTTASFIEPEILALPQDKLDTFMRETPELALYTHQLQDLNRQRPHVRSAEVEAILASVGEVADAPDNIFSMINNADMKFPPIKDEKGQDVELTHGNYLVYIRSADRRVRKDAFDTMHSTFLKQRNTIASTLAAQVKSDLFYTRQRDYSTCRERALARNNIPVSVYDNLVETVSEHIPLLNRYLKLRKRILHLDELHMYDLYVPIVEETNDATSYAQARDNIVAALSPLGEKYSTILQQAFTQRWIDVYETSGKRSGAYSGGAYGTLPFILMNFQGKRESMFTLAHELGHSMHSYFTRTNQPYQYGDYTIFVAEVASTLNEGLLTEYLLKNTSDRAVRLAILNHSLEDIRSTLFRQTMFAEFEQQIHSCAEQGEPLTADRLTEMYAELNRKYYGAETVIDDLIGIEWARIPHFYYNFYVYQYATGISAASALVQQILHEGQPAVDRYLKFLSSGSSDYSIELLKKAGVDMTTPGPVRQAFQLFETHLTQMEQLLG